MSGWYFERLSQGEWRPRWYADKPRTTKNDNFLVSSEGGLAPIRGLAPVDDRHAGQSLEELQAIYGVEKPLRIDKMGPVPGEVDG